MKPPITTDRILGALVGLALVAGGLLLVDWWGGWVLTDLPQRLSTAAAIEATEQDWWPWAVGAVGLLLGLLGLWWLLAHLRRDVVGESRLGASGPTGRVRVDLDSVADATAGRFAEIAPVPSAQGSTTTQGGHQLLVVSARVESGADVDTLVSAAQQISDEVETAFPDDPVTCRVLIDEPRGQRRSRRGQVRVS